MAKRYSTEVALAKAQLEAIIKNRRVIPSVRYQHGLGRHIPVAMDIGAMTWVEKGIFGLHGNQVEPVAFLTGFAQKFRDVKGKKDDLPPVAYALKLAKIYGLTLRPGRTKVYTAEATEKDLIETYGERARYAIEQGKTAGERIRSEVFGF